MWEEREKALKTNFYCINTFYLSFDSQKADISMTKAVIYITFTQFKVSAANFVFVFLMLKFSIFFNSWHTYLWMKFVRICWRAELDLINVSQSFPSVPSKLLNS